MMTIRLRMVHAAIAAGVVAAGTIACGAPENPARVPSPPPITTSVPAPSTSPPSVQPVTAASLGASWHPGCPLPPEQLRQVTVRYAGTDGQTHAGSLVVHQDLVPAIVAIFEQLYELRYPIEKIQPPERYPNAEDELSMEDNNTSAFSCRGIPGSSRWSEHALGRAVDINPLWNPYVDSKGDLQPKTARKYLDRTRRDPGLFHDGDPAVRAFTDRGWTWGGHWTNPIDYQHFELP